MASTRVTDNGDHFLVENDGAPWKVVKHGLAPTLHAHLAGMADAARLADGGDAATEDTVSSEPVNADAEWATHEPDVKNVPRGEDPLSPEDAALEPEWARPFLAMKDDPAAADAVWATHTDDVKNVPREGVKPSVDDQALEMARGDYASMPQDVREMITPERFAGMVRALAQELTARQAAPVVVVEKAEGGDVGGAPRVLEDHADHYVLDAGDGTKFRVAKSGLSSKNRAEIDAMARADSAVVHADGGYGMPADADAGVPTQAAPAVVSGGDVAGVQAPAQQPSAPLVVVNAGSQSDAGTPAPVAGPEPVPAQKSVRELYDDAMRSGASDASATAWAQREALRQSGQTAQADALAQQVGLKQSDVAAPIAKPPVLASAQDENAQAHVAPRVSAPAMSVQPRPTVDDALMATNEAKAAADSKAAVAMAEASARAKAQESYLDAMRAAQAERAQFVRDAAARADAYERQISSAQIDPNHFFASRSTGQNILGSIGIMLGAYGAGLTGGPNLALEQLNKNIDRDIDAQKANLGKTQTLYSMNLARTRDAEQAYAQTQADMLAVAKGQLQLTSDQFGGQEAAANAQAIRAQIDQQLAALRESQADNRMRRAVESAQIQHMQNQDALANLVRGNAVGAKQDYLQGERAQAAAAGQKAISANENLGTLNKWLLGGVGVPGAHRDMAIGELADQYTRAAQSAGVGRTRMAQIAKEIESLKDRSLDSTSKARILGIVHEINTLNGLSASKPGANGRPGVSMSDEGE